MTNTGTVLGPNPSSNKTESFETPVPLNGKVDASLPVIKRNPLATAFVPRSFSAPAAIAVIGKRDCIEFVNPRFVAIFGYELHELAKDPLWWQPCEPGTDDLQPVRSWSSWLNQATRELGEREPIEYQLRCKNRVLRTAEVFIVTAGDQKLLLFNDVTERKRAEAALGESEERFRTMADAAPVMIWISGPDKCVEFVNRSWLSFTGKPLERDLRDGWAEPLHPEDIDGCIATYHAAFEARRPFQMEYRARRADGEYRWLLNAGAPRFTADGSFAGYVGTCTDISELKPAQEKAIARQKLESLGVVSSGIAHDFNNLIGCILADAGVMATELNGGSPLSERVNHIKAVAMRAGEIVRQIMDYAGQEPNHLERMGVSKLIREMLELLRVCIPKTAELIVDLPEDLPALHGNCAQIRQVLMNLIINAAEALGSREGTITISGRRVERGPGHDLKSDAGLAPGDYVRLQIADTGSGMTEHTRTHIFEPFFSTKHNGRGLGLAAVKGIVESHGGYIEVDSSLGAGTRFRIWLPTEKACAQRNRPPVILDRKTTASESGTILVVEDEIGLRLAVAHVLRKRGFSVMEAEDGDLALALIRANAGKIALVLLDLTLPGTSGQDVLQELRRLRVPAKVILTSGYGRDSLGGLLRVQPVAGFLRKPYPLETLVSTIRDALANGSMADSKRHYSRGA